MYQPPHFIETDRDRLHGLIRSHPLGLLISNGPDGPIANPLPFLLDNDGSPNGVLRAHLSRANPHWKAIAEAPQAPVLVVFQGTNAYVTPSWYETKRQTGKVVPTWNYAMVQARGIATVIEDAGWLSGQIAELTATHEAERAEPWQVTDAPDNYIAAQIRGIVGLRIEITDIQGKWKVSQNRPVEDRAGVAEGLHAQADERSGEMELLVRDYGGLDRS